MTTIARHAAIDMARSGAEKVSAASAAFDAELAERLAAPLAGGDPLTALAPFLLPRQH